MLRRLPPTARLGERPDAHFSQQTDVKILLPHDEAKQEGIDAKKDCVSECESNERLSKHLNGAPDCQRDGGTGENRQERARNLLQYVNRSYWRAARRPKNNWDD